MKVFINSISAKRGGAVTYLQNVLPELKERLDAAVEEGSRIIVWRGVAATADEAWPEGVEIRTDDRSSGGVKAVGGSWRRLWFDQVGLPAMIRQEKADVLFSSANFGPLRCPCRQVLFVRNAAYFDRVFLSRMPSPKVRAYYTLQRWLTLRCIDAADHVLFPTQAMLDLVAGWKRGRHDNWGVAPFGIRHDLFCPADQPGDPSDGLVRLLNVSIYSDQKNFGTLLRAVESLDQSKPNRYRLRLTAGFNQDWLGGSAFFPRYTVEQALYRKLNAAGVAEDNDWNAYSTLPSLYQGSDVFVFSSYVESFGHPLVEAMASGLPVVAADVPVNREMCGEAAVYFSPFDVAACAEAIKRVSEDASLRERLRADGLVRAQAFRWSTHSARLAQAFGAAAPAPAEAVRQGS